ncbi:MAG: DUF4405 domain-containing protein [Syntrophomonadaceae bacterium]
MAKSSKIFRTYTRSVTAVSMLILWGFSAISGLILWLAPTGPRSGRMLLLLGMTKQQWGDWHFWFSILAISVTVVHLIIDWRGFIGCINYLVKNR